ncbi:P-loop NTPase fold protein [Rhodococcus sp. NCIMB 12038]|uniref:KAP family P-loop NTPase fold protein n=1 Tax=Rhodococcus sp. NCIMB 12038 TaxID=933800 RepID=UPI000B3D4D75|nr:P-loop NTPase fold protein [Rhodococcus sp. NCIMB 12038]OUS91939.1 P-loop ATPase [Rhodococcus sp. NCIMB 12038]
MPQPSPNTPLWDDNPSEIDFLGFDAVIRPVLDAIQTPNLDPLTVGIQSPWGGGKSTALKLLADELAPNRRYVVVRTDPWQYDDHDDVRGTLIAEVLDTFREHFDNNAAIVKKADELLMRVSWSRVTIALAKGALTSVWNPAELVKAFTPRKRSSPESMSGFKSAFGELVEYLPDVDRVVVMVDDLDRCLPNAVMATLEAIKLFLAVPKMVFILAADQDMVKDAIAASLSATNRSERFADRYLEKIVQIPVSLPRLSEDEAEAYVGLLLSHQYCPEPQHLPALIDHCATRRRTNSLPLLSDFNALPWAPSSDLLALAAQLTQGLSADTLSSPRQIKRFLNAYGIRSAVARARGVTIEPAVLMKILLLEDQHRQSFEILASVSAPDHRNFIRDWEEWAVSTDTEAAPPDGIDKRTQNWARSQPSLADEDLSPYLSLAATLLSISVGGQTTDRAGTLVSSLLGEGEAARDAALTQLSSLPVPEQESAFDYLVSSSRRLTDLDPMFTSIIRWADQLPALVPKAVRAIRDHWRNLTPGAVVELQNSQTDELRDLVREIANDSSIDPMTRVAAEMGPSS